MLPRAVSVKSKVELEKRPEIEIEKPALPVADPVGDTNVTDLRFWSNPEYTRIVVNAEGERAYSHRLLKKDPNIDKPFQRLYIDIEQARLGSKIAEHTTINDNLLKQARAGQYLPHTVRVVVDIKSFENYKIFSLRDPFRIVIDVWGKGSSGSPVKKEGEKVAQTKPSTIKERRSRITTDNLQSSDIARQLALGVRNIVIDPGHGGSDPGAPGYYKNVWEKHSFYYNLNKLSKNDSTIIIDCYKKNIAIRVNREVHKKMVQLSIPHRYHERSYTNLTKRLSNQFAFCVSILKK